MKKNKCGKLIALIISITVGLVIIGFLAFKYIAPFGKAVSYKFGLKIPGAEEATTFSPGKDSTLKIPSQIIKTSISKFSLELLSKEIKSIKATLRFKKGPKEIKLGVRGNEKDKFLYQPLYHSFLHDLNWEKIEEGGFTLWQKEKKYQNLYDFVNNPPLDAKTASYFIDQDQLSLLETSKTIKEAKTVIGTPLRGSHIVLLRADKKPLVLKVAKQDANGYEGKDELKITILKGQTTLVEKTIGDDGITDTSRLKTEPQEETITLEDIKPGIYEVILDLKSEGGDSLITKIETNQSKVIFKNRIFFLGNKPTTLWSNIKSLAVHTVHGDSLQTIRLNDKYDLKIEEVTKQHSFDLESLTGEKKGLYKLESPKNDLVFQGKGYFAFSEDSFFYPEVVRSTDLNEFDNLEEVDYILTTYLPPKKEGDWLIAETVFDPKDIKIDGDKLYFSLEVPEIAKYGGELEIDYLEIETQSEGGLEKVFKKKSEEKPASIEVSEGEKKNFFQETGQKIGWFFSNIYNQTKTFFVSSYNKVFKKKKVGQELPTSALSPTPSPKPSPIPSPSPKAEKFDILVKVLNGGAESGAANQFADKLKENGFANAVFDNADSTDYQEATINYREANKSEREKISRLLLDFGYKNVTSNQTATSSSEIIVILGKK